MSFEEAETVFKDEKAIQYFDPDHSDDEDRFILLGLSIRHRVLVVCHCFRESELMIRIVSARRAGDPAMRDHYDFSKMKGKKNPYVKYLKQPITIRLDKDVVGYFKAMSAETGIPYQNLINLYLRDCAQHGRKLKMRWTS